MVVIAVFYRLELDHKKSNKGEEVMKIKRAVAERIIKLCQQNNISANALARAAAVPPSTLKNILNNGSQNPGIVTIKKLCDGLDISIIDFFDDPLFANLEQEIE